jgi:hypothetical protein
MKECDYKDFSKAIKLSYVLVNIEAPADSVIKVLFDMFKNYPKDLILDAIEFHTRISQFAIKPADITQYIEIKLGLQEETLRNEANTFFNKYLVNAPKRCDVVIEDIKMAKAFSDCFTDFETFTKNDAQRKVNDNREYYDSKLFADTVVANKMNFDFESVPRVFKGYRNLPKTINVFFIGNYENCKTLADQYYATTGEDQQYDIQYPIDPARRIEQKKTDATKDMSKEERLNNIPLEELTALALKFDPKYKTRKKK